MLKMPVLGLHFDLTFGFPAMVGSRLEWCDATRLDALLVFGAVALIAF